MTDKKTIPVSNASSGNAPVNVKWRRRPISPQEWDERERNGELNAGQLKTKIESPQISQVKIPKKAVPLTQTYNILEYDPDNDPHKGKVFEKVPWEGKCFGCLWWVHKKGSAWWMGWCAHHRLEKSISGKCQLGDD